MKKPASPTLIRLWSDAWQRWNVPPVEPPTLQSAPETRRAQPLVFALPARSAVCVALWIDSSDPEVVRDSVNLELELRGLVSARQEAQSSIVASFPQDGKTLAIAAVYPSRLPEEAGSLRIGWYEASPLLVDLPEEAISFWIEGGDLVAVVSRDGKAVYWTTTDLPESAAQFSFWVETLQLQLHAQRILRTAFPSHIVTAELRSRLSLERVATSNFVPSLANASFAWKPTEVRSDEVRAASSSRLRLILLVILGIALCAIAAASVHLGILHARARSLSAEIQRLEAETATFQPIIQEWEAVGPTAETAQFPLETLLAVVRDLPEQGIRLTSYDLDNKVVTIEGEAASARIASAFASSLSQDPTLATVSWEMPAPTLLPDNTARFHVEGRPK